MTRVCLFLLLVVSFVSCAKAPPTLSPAGALAFNQTRVVKSLDLFRDTAIAAEAQTPPLVSTATTRKIVVYHQASLRTIQASSAGWKATVTTGLEEVMATLSQTERNVLTPYVALLRAILQEVN